MKILNYFPVMFLVVSLLLSCAKDTVDPNSSTPSTNVGGNLGNTNPTPDAGEKPVDFSLTSDENKKISVSDYKDKVVVLFFFGNGCSSCKATSPSIQTNFVNNYKDKNVEVVGLDTWDGSLASVKSFKDASKLTFPLLLNASTVAKSLSTTYDRLMVIDKKGIVRFKGAQLAGNDITNAKKAVDEYLVK